MKLILIFALLFTTACKESDKMALLEAMAPGSSIPFISDPPLISTPQTFTEEFMTLIDDHRVSIGLSPLILDEGLSGLAEQHSRDMASGALAFGHTGFSDRCTTGRSLIGGGNWCGENVAMGQKTPLAAFNAWMNSPGHRANIENSRATHTGFGYQQSSNSVYYWTQIFIEHN